VFILVETLLVLFLIRYKRKHPDKHGKNIHGSTKAEVIWTLIPAIVLVLIGIYSSGMTYAIQETPADVYEIKVTGYKWAWKFEYPNGATTNGDLRIPAGKDVLFKIYSKDVIHSFWIPEFRMKQDAVPGRMTQYSVKAEDVAKLLNEDGYYKQRIICAEYCGDNHSKMLADLTIMPAAEFDKWVAEEKVRKKVDGPSVAIENGCTSCHTIDGGKSAGPTWKGLWGSEKKLANGQTVKVDAEYIKESIINPGAKVVEGFGNMMPAYQIGKEKGQIDEEQLNNLIKYIETLK
jgi:cytochrome c oxidase subunit 2